MPGWLEPPPAAMSDKDDGSGGATPTTPTVAGVSPIKTRITDDGHKPSEPGVDSPLSPPSEGLAGPERLAPDPDSPTSRLLVRAAHRSLEAKSSPERRFNFLTDIARNPRLAAAARLEMDAAAAAQAALPPLDVGGGDAGVTPSPGSAGGAPTPSGRSTARAAAAGSARAAGGPAYFQHASDVERQATLVADLDAEAAQEAKINADMANVMLSRLKSGRAAAERILSVLQAFASAEATYARAMGAISGLNLAGDADGASLRGAAAEFGSLPAALGELHAGVADALNPVIRAVQAVVGELRRACEEIGAGTAAAARGVDAGRRGLRAALAAHRDACRTFDAHLAERRRAASRSRPCESDPWVAEGRLVERQAALQAAQTQQRRYAAGAFRAVGELERRRVGVAAAALAALLECPRTVAIPEVAASAEALAAALDALDVEADLAAFSDVAGSSITSGDALSQRQAELVEHLWNELTRSAEIVRQGEVKRLDGGAWAPGYAVLTRAGFLHWFDAPKGEEPPGAWGPAGPPAASLNLARCEFEAGDAPAWRIIEGGGLNGWLGVGRRSLTLRADDVEDAMNWAAEIREAIAAREA